VLIEYVDVIGGWIVSMSVAYASICVGSIGYVATRVGGASTCVGGSWMT